MDSTRWVSGDRSAHTAVGGASTWSVHSKCGWGRVSQDAWRPCGPTSPLSTPVVDSEVVTTSVCRPDDRERRSVDDARRTDRTAGRAGARCPVRTPRRAPWERSRSIEPSLATDWSHCSVIIVHSALDTAGTRVTLRIEGGLIHAIVLIQAIDGAHATPNLAGSPKATPASRNTTSLPSAHRDSATAKAPWRSPIILQRTGGGEYFC